MLGGRAGRHDVVRLGVSLDLDWRIVRAIIRAIDSKHTPVGEFNLDESDPGAVENSERRARVTATLSLAWWYVGPRHPLSSPGLRPLCRRPIAGEAGIAELAPMIHFVLREPAALRTCGTT
eukprot:scaffold41758_cov63-Phaeocystis_antarctica.AAC.2